MKANSNTLTKAHPQLLKICYKKSSMGLQIETKLLDDMLGVVNQKSTSLHLIAAVTCPTLSALTGIVHFP